MEVLLRQVQCFLVYIKPFMVVLAKKIVKTLSVVDVVQVGAEAWFEDAFGENKLSTGIIVEWPSSMISNVADVSPLHTRTNRKRK